MFGRPAHGDLSQARTHAATSRALDAWERVEIALFMLDGIFCQAMETRSTYGRGMIFRTRLKALRLASERYFIKRPNQAHEGEFSLLADRLLGFSLRRHDIAHGIVFPWPTDANYGSVEFGLMPAFYNITRPRDTKRFPNYVYNSEMLNEFEIKFSNLERDVKLFTHRFLHDV